MERIFSKVSHFEDSILTKIVYLRPFPFLYESREKILPPDSFEKMPLENLWKFSEKNLEILLKSIEVSPQKSPKSIFSENLKVFDFINTTSS